MHVVSHLCSAYLEELEMAEENEAAAEQALNAEEKAQLENWADWHRKNAGLLMLILKIRES